MWKFISLVFQIPRIGVWGSKHRSSQGMTGGFWKTRVLSFGFYFFCWNPLKNIELEESSSPNHWVFGCFNLKKTATALSPCYESLRCVWEHIGQCERDFSGRAPKHLGVKVVVFGGPNGVWETGETVTCSKRQMWHVEWVNQKKTTYVLVKSLQDDTWS